MHEEAFPRCFLLLSDRCLLCRQLYSPPRFPSALQNITNRAYHLSEYHEYDVWDEHDPHIIRKLSHTAQYLIL